MELWEAKNNQDILKEEKQSEVTYRTSYQG